jgi:asparagine synthase (glutamine-hydrolysing)
MISNFFTDAVKKRIETTERPISCLLSGGLDSSIVAAIVGTKHTEIVVTEEDFFNAIPDVIYMIESYDTTTVRASVGNYLVAKYIAKNSEAKVIFNGDGSDELMGGYLYMNKAPNHLEFDKECKRLLSDIYLYDVLRSDKYSISVTFRK